MKLAFAVFVFFVTAYQPAVAAINSSEDSKVVPNGSDYKQSEKSLPETQEKVLLEGAQGRMLYQNHCKTCHESTVHIRNKRKAKNYKDLSYWVNQRADWLKLGWTDQEKQEVMDYLNERFYKYPTPD